MAEQPTKSRSAKQRISTIRLSMFAAIVLLGISLSLSMAGAAAPTNRVAAHGYMQGSIMLVMVHAFANKTTFKAQSAMEYLMTYGWAILIISIVLGSLFSLGVFNSGSTLPNACIPGSGYYCSIASFAHGTNANIVATIGQSTGTSWTSWAYYFCDGCSTGSAGPFGTAYNVVSTAGGTPLNSGSQTTVVLTVPTSVSTTAAGAGTSGTVWVCWTTASYLISSTGNPGCTSASNTVNFVQIAQLTAKTT